MEKTERQKMSSGCWYTCLDDELEELRQTARRAVHAHNASPPDSRGPLAPELAALFGSTGRDVMIEAPFHCSYGFNINLGNDVYINSGAVFLDSASIRIGDRTLIGPNVQIYCAEHHKDPKLRSRGLELALPVSIGADVWLGGGVVVLPGRTIGSAAIVGAGSVVTRDVKEGETVVGNPLRSIASKS